MMFTWPIVPIVTAAVAYLALFTQPLSLSAQGRPYGAWFIDSSFFAVGAIQPVPCNDGTFVGGALYCNRTTFDGYADYRRPCSEIFINRSYDGGVTWVQERAESPSHAAGNIVRVRDGALIASDASMYHGFLRSTDNGRTWHRHIMTDTNAGYHDPTDATEPVVGDNLQRDDTGVLFWVENGTDRVRYSIDDGAIQTNVAIRAEFERDSPLRRFFLLANNGAYANRYHATADYGRTWTFTNYRDRMLVPDPPFSSVDGFRITGSQFAYINRDSLVIEVSNDPPDNWSSDRVIPRTVIYSDPLTHRFRMDSSRQWTNRFHFSKPEECRAASSVLDLATSSVIDSIGRLHLNGMQMLAPASNVCFPWEYRFPDGRRDTSVFPDISRWRIPWQTPPTVFYDLDGNLHGNSRASFQHADHVRPVSILDKLHTCGGMQFLVGGGAINGVTIAEQFTKNATITWTISPNRRMVFIDVKAIDTSKAVYVCYTVGDSLRPGTTICDSTNIPTPRPTFRITGKERHPQFAVVLYDVEADPYEGWRSWWRVGRKTSIVANGSFDSVIREGLDVYLLARDRNGCLRCSDTIPMRDGSTTVGHDFVGSTLPLTLTLAPNPASGEVTMEFSSGRLGGAPYRIEVVNMLGMVVYSDESTMVGGVTNVATLSVAALPRGAYVVRIVARGSVASQVLFVQ